jgi:hypothetical protein
MKEHAVLGSAGEDAVEHQGVKVDVEVQAAETLYAEHRPALGPVDPVAHRTRTVARERGLDEDPRECGQHVGLVGGEPA